MDKMKTISIVISVILLLLWIVFLISYFERSNSPHPKKLTVYCGMFKYRNVDNYNWDFQDHVWRIIYTKNGQKYTVKTNDSCHAVDIVK